jgi:hypothetical protein
MSDDKLSALGQEYNEIDGKIKIYATEIKSLTTGAYLCIHTTHRGQKSRRVGKVEGNAFGRRIEQGDRSGACKGTDLTFQLLRKDCPRLIGTTRRLRKNRKRRQIKGSGLFVVPHRSFQPRNESLLTQTGPNGEVNGRDAGRSSTRMSSSSPAQFSRPHFEFEHRFWHIVSDALSPQDAAAQAEELGIEFDTQEHITLEQGSICARPTAVSQNLKRKRE